MLSGRYLNSNISQLQALKGFDEWAQVNVIAPPEPVPPSSVTLLERSSLKQSHVLTRLMRAVKAAKEVFCNELLEVLEPDTGLPKSSSSRLVDCAMGGLGIASIAIMALLNAWGRL
jgi:hypothetical protein